MGDLVSKYFDQEIIKIEQVQAIFEHKLVQVHLFH